MRRMVFGSYVQIVRMKFHFKNEVSSCPICHNRILPCSMCYDCTIKGDICPVWNVKA